MPSFDIVKTWNRPESFRAQSVIGSFTLQDVKMQKHFAGSIPLRVGSGQSAVSVGEAEPAKQT